MDKYQVIDARNNEILFESENKQLCINFMNDLWEENSTDYIYAWFKEKESKTE